MPPAKGAPTQANQKPPPVDPESTRCARVFSFVWFSTLFGVFGYTYVYTCVYIYIFFFGSFVLTFFVTLGTLWDHFGFILKLFWDRFGVNLGSFWIHSGVILALGVAPPARNRELAI